MITCFSEFLTKFFPGKEDTCWNWFGNIDNTTGYGRLRINNILYYAHIISYSYYNKLNKIDLCVLHSCDNRKCVNPKHLFLGTRIDNMNDKCNKNRQAKGESQGLSKLTENEVLEIKQLYKIGNYTQKQLGNEYGICRTTIEHIVNNINWKHLL